MSNSYGIRGPALDALEGYMSNKSTHPNPNATITERKIAIDSRMSIVTDLLFQDIDSLGIPDALGASIRADVTAEVSHLEAYKELSFGYFITVAIHSLNALRANENDTDLLESIDEFREAYYDMKPNHDSTERSYKSIDALIDAGVSTASQHIAHMLYSLEAAGIAAEIPRTERGGIAARSGHLVTLLAKLKIEDLERYVSMLNAHEEAVYAVVSLQNTRNGKIAKIHPRIFPLMRELILDPKPEYEHRPHLGCPASVSLLSASSVIDKLWQVSVASLKSAGMWDD